MSLNQLNLDLPKPWLNARVCNLTVDCDANIPNLEVDISQIESTGTPGFLVDDGIDIIRRDIELADLQGIGAGAPVGETFLKHQAGTVSFVTLPPSPGVNTIYTADDVIADPVREVDCDSNQLLFRNPSVCRIGETTDAYVEVDQDFAGSGSPGCTMTKAVGAASYFSSVGNLGSGDSAIMGYSSGAVANSVDVDSDEIVISATDGVTNESITVDGSNGQILINSQSLNLVQVPVIDNEVFATLVRDTTGEIKIRQSNSVTGYRGGLTAFTPAVGVNVLNFNQVVFGAYTAGGVFNPATGEITIGAAVSQIWSFNVNVGYRETAAHANLGQTLRIKVNGLVFQSNTSTYSLNNNAFLDYSCNTMLRLVPGDVVTFEFVNAGSGATDQIAGGTFSTMSCYRLS